MTKPDLAALSVRIMDNSPADVLMRGMLRYEYWVERFGWAPRPEDPNQVVEFDSYDKYAVHFGVFNSEGELVGYCRLVLGGPKRMLKVFDVFHELPRNTRRADMTVEVSRMLVTDAVPRGREAKQAAQLLYREIYQWAKRNGRRYWYIEAEEGYIALLQSQGFSFKVISAAHAVDAKGTRTYPALLDLVECEAEFIRKRPGLLEWYTEGLPADLLPSPLPELSEAV